MQKLESNGFSSNPSSIINGVIFRRTIRASYASLDLIKGDTHTTVLVQFHQIKGLASSRSYIRRECKLGTEIELSGDWVDGRFHVDIVEQDGKYLRLSILQKQKLDMIACQRAREKFYPSCNKQKAKPDFDQVDNDSMSKKKQKKNEGNTGHGGGIGKRRQGEIVRDFLMRLVVKQFEKKGEVDNVKVDTEISNRSMSTADRMVILDHNDVDERTIHQATEFLNRGSGVMDVAGGSGHVSLDLSLKGIRSTVIDPRETVGKLPARDRKALKKAIKAKQNSFTMKDNDDSGDIMVVPSPPPIQFDALRAWFAKRPDGIDTKFREGTSNSEVLDSAKGPITVCTMCSPDNLLSSCSAIVALHPDEATGDIVDFAVKHRLPFLIVPCCVFSRLFPFRFIPAKDANDPNQKKLVSTYEELLAYLVAKDDSIRISKLDFDGSNLAIWSTFPNEERRESKSLDI
jgi:hypothetical protein